MPGSRFNLLPGFYFIPSGFAWRNSCAIFSVFGAYQDIDEIAVYLASCCKIRSHSILLR